MRSTNTDRVVTLSSRRWRRKVALSKMAVKKKRKRLTSQRWRRRSQVCPRFLPSSRYVVTCSVLAEEKLQLRSLPLAPTFTSFSLEFSLGKVHRIERRIHTPLHCPGGVVLSSSCFGQRMSRAGIWSSLGGWCSAKAFSYIYTWYGVCVSLCSYWCVSLMWVCYLFISNNQSSC